MKKELRSENINNYLIKLASNYDSFCNYYFNKINNTEYSNNIYTILSLNHHIQIFKFLGANLTWDRNSRLYCKFFLNDNYTKHLINSNSSNEFTTEYILIWNFLNNPIFQSSEAKFVNLRLFLKDNFCYEFFNYLKSFTVINKKFRTAFSPYTFTTYFPPIMDEILPICNSTVKLACKFLNNSNPAQWSIQILTWISSLIRTGDYCGVFKVLITMCSVLNYGKDGSSHSFNFGVFPYIWEGLLEMFLLLDQRISKSLINIVKAIPIYGMFFKSDTLKKFFIEERVNLSIELQDKLSERINNVESNIKKLFDKKILNSEFSKNCRVLDKKKIKDNSKFIHFSKYSTQQKTEILNNIFENKYKKICSIDGLKLNSTIPSINLNFNVIKYENSILTVNAICNNQVFRKGDVTLIQPFNNKTAINGSQAMSFKQLAIVLNSFFIKRSPKFEGNALTLRLKITDPGMDPSIYKHCIIIYLLNYYKYKKKIALIKRYSLMFSQPNLSLKEKVKREIFEKLINNSLYESNQDISNTLVIFSSERVTNFYLKNEIEIKWAYYRKELLNIDNNSFSENKRQELFSYMLNYPNIDCNVIKKLVYLTELQKHIIFLALSSIIVLINKMSYTSRINIICMITFCKKMINPNTKILIFASKYEYAKIIKRVLRTLKISSKILEEEFSIFKAEQIKYATKKNFEGLPGYENWLNKEIIIEERDILIINNIEINYKFVKKNFDFERSHGSSYFDHLLVEDIGVLTKLDILLLLILPFNNVTLFCNKIANKK